MVLGQTYCRALIYAHRTHPLHPSYQLGYDLLWLHLYTTLARIGSNNDSQLSGMFLALSGSEVDRCASPFGSGLSLLAQGPRNLPLPAAHWFTGRGNREGGAYGRLETPSPACLRQGYGLLVPHRLPLAHFCVSSCALFCYVVPGCVPPCPPFPACLSTPGWQADLCSAIPDRQRQSRLLPDGEQAIRLCRMEIARHQAQMRKRPLRHLAAPLQSHLLEPACS